MPPAPGQSREDYEREKRKRAQAAAAQSASSTPSASGKAASDAKEAKEAKKRAEKSKRYAAGADPSTALDVVGGDDAAALFADGEWAPRWAPVEFDGDACLANVTAAGKAKDGFFVPAGSMLPLGAVMPPMTVLKYGGYMPAGTAFRGGVLVPLHARMINILPQEAVAAAGKHDEPICVVM